MSWKLLALTIGAMLAVSVSTTFQDSTKKKLIGAGFILLVYEGIRKRARL